MVLSDERREKFLRKLIELRHRVSGNVDDVVDTINDHSNTLSNTSAVPVHLADVASNEIFADVEILENQNKILRQIETALQRIESGSYGTCEHCGIDIDEARLEVLPFATVCVACAEKGYNATTAHSNDSKVPTVDRDNVRLRGFQAIEFAEREGLSLNKSADHIDDEVFGLTIAEAEAIASDRPDLIWLDVPPSEYFGDRRNMKPER